MSSSTIKIQGIIKGFKADTYFKAFTLASLILALTTIGALYIHDHLYRLSKSIIGKPIVPVSPISNSISNSNNSIKTTSNNNNNNNNNNISLKFKILRPLFLFIITFIIGLLSYIIMFYLFGFGSGMLISMPKKKYNKMVKTSLLKPVSIKK
jgi:hypothetical protein